MAVNPIYGPIPDKLASDPNGVPGQTKGNVQVTDSSTYQRGTREPTAGNMIGLPPFLTNPSKNPVEEAYGPPPSVTGPGEG